MAATMLLAGCNGKNKIEYKPESTGAINSLTVVMDNDLWKGPVGDKVREHFAAPVVGLIWDEPQFTINQVPPKVFTGALRTTRSILVVGLDSVDVAHMKTDVYATPQKVGVVRGSTPEIIEQGLDSQSDAFIKEYKDLEVSEAQKRFLRSVSKEKVLQDKFGVQLTIPSIYKVGKQEDNFVWIDREIQKGNMNIIAYTVPENYFKSDSTLVQDIIKMRDSIGKKYIPGPDMPGKITYMDTEKGFSPHIYPTTIGGHKGAEVRGIWEVHNYPMAGPFLMYIVNDKEHNRKLILEGFTFAPSTNKRDYMFELEAILKTLKFVDETKPAASPETK